jgi:hypothetical protein
MTKHFEEVLVLWPSRHRGRVITHLAMPLSAYICLCKSAHSIGISGSRFIVYVWHEDEYLYTSERISATLLFGFHHVAYKDAYMYHNGRFEQSVCNQWTGYSELTHRQFEHLLVYRLRCLLCLWALLGECSGVYWAFQDRILPLHSFYMSITSVIIDIRNYTPGLLWLHALKCLHLCVGTSCHLLSSVLHR